MFHARHATLLWVSACGQGSILTPDLSTETSVAMDAETPFGFSGNDLVAWVAARPSYDATADANEDDVTRARLRAHGPFTVTLDPADATAALWARSDTDEPSSVIVRVKTRIQSADGALDVVGQVPMTADELSDDAVAWTQPQNNPIGGELPDWTDALADLAFEETPCTRRKTPTLRATGGLGLRLNGVHASGIQLSLIAAWPHCSDRALTSLTLLPTR